MPFLTQGKTNWKYILIVIVLVVIVGGGIILKYNQRMKTESCIGEDEDFDQLSLTNPKECCEGLTVSNVCSYNISIGEECYAPPIFPVGCTHLGCSNCGDGICKENENICSCPKDCIGKKEPNYATVEEFCNSREYISYCIEHFREGMKRDLCKLCE